LFRRRHPGILAAWLAYLALLAPNSGLVTIGSVIAADRYSYLSTMSGVPILAAMIARLTNPGRRPISVRLTVAATGLVLVALLAASSWRLCRTWRDTVALASNALVHGGRDPEVYLGLGWGLEHRGDLSGAEVTYREALRLEPNHVTAMMRIALLLVRQGRYARATDLLTEAVRLQPGLPEAHNSLGRAFGAQGRYDDAIAEFKEALRLRPAFGEARSNLAVARSLKGQ
jgi:Flp pilus assembly protein TadD